MALHLTAEFSAGAAFGGALLLSGVYAPAVIKGQMQLLSFSMLETFMTASAISAIVIYAADKAGICPSKVRPPRALKFLRIPFSANVVGGAFVGAGMAMTGACPGTVLVQMATGVKSGFWVAAGGVVGGTIYSASQKHFTAPVKQPSRPSTAENVYTNSQSRPTTSLPPTLYAGKYASWEGVLLVFEALALVTTGVSSSMAPHNTSAFVSPAIGGVLIGMAQAATILMNRRTVGASTAYQDMGDWLLSVARGRIREMQLLTDSVVFVLGILTGSALLATEPAVLVQQNGELPTRFVSFLGGLVSIFGARLAGGCTSGHGISGMASFSIASFITVGSMFGGGILTAQLLR